MPEVSAARAPSLRVGPVRWTIVRGRCDWLPSVERDPAPPVDGSTLRSERYESASGGGAEGPIGSPPLLAVPNFSEGRDPSVSAEIAQALQTRGVRLLDRHADADHHRSVFSLAGGPGALAPAILAGARVALARVDLRTPRGLHPHVGALDVAPIVHLDDAGRGAACAEALVLGDLIGAELDIPVFLYGPLADGRTRAQLRRGGLELLTERMRAGELQPDFGPCEPHPTAGVTLVAARRPLIAFNLELSPPADGQDARRIAALIREGAEHGLPGVRAIGLQLSASPGRAQVSTNVEDPLNVPLARVVEAVRRHAEVSAAELVGLTPRAALRGFPSDLAILGFDPARQVIEQALGL